MRSVSLISSLSRDSTQGFALGFQLCGTGIHRFAKRFARLEVRDSFFRNGNALATARIAAHAGRAAIDGEAAKSADFDAVTANQCIVHRIQNSP